MKNIVLYESKSGNTLQYAKWIAEELGWEIRTFSSFKRFEIENYQNIIFGSGVYMGKMNKIKKVLKWFKDKPIIIFACAGNNNVKEYIDDIKSQNFNTNQLSFHKFFYLPGGVDFTKATGIQHNMLNFYRNVLEKKKNRSKDEQAILDSFYKPTNFVRKNEIGSIVAYTKSLMN